MARFAALFITPTNDHRESRILREACIRQRPFAQVEDAASIGSDDARVAAMPAEAGGYLVRVPQIRRPQAEKPAALKR